MADKERREQAAPAMTGRIATMDEDRISGTARNVGGKIEEGVGRLTGDARTQIQGKLDQAAGAAQDLYGQTADAARDTAATFDKWLRRTIETQPYTVAIVALGIGWLLGRMHRRSDRPVMAARPARAEAQSPTAPPPLWPVLCSAVLVGMMIASGVRRAYRTPVTTAGRPATGAFGTGRSTDEPVAAQHERAQESGRAVTPRRHGRYPGEAGKTSSGAPYEQIGEDRLLAVAAGVVFYGLLAVFPAVTALVSLYGLFASPSAISDQLSLLAGILPQGAVEILREQIGRLTAGSGAKLGFGFIFGLAVALWSANAGMKAIMDALNVVYEEKENAASSSSISSLSPLRSRPSSPSC
jgi:Predicted membrane protein